MHLLLNCDTESSKSYFLTLILASFFGPVGVHRLYVGKYTSATVCLSIFGILAFAVVFSCWGVIHDILGVFLLVFWVGDVMVIRAGRFRDSEGKVVKSQFWRKEV